MLADSGDCWTCSNYTTTTPRWTAAKAARFEGRRALRAYWILKLLDQDPGGFDIEAVIPETGGVYLEYRDCGGQAFRTRFRFNAAGKSVRTTCGPLVGKDDALTA